MNYLYALCLFTYLLSCLYTPCELYVACIACMHQVRLYAACITLHSLSSDVLFFHGEQRKLDLVFFLFLGKSTKVGLDLGSLGSECDQGALCETPKEAIKNILEK